MNLSINARPLNIRLIKTTEEAWELRQIDIPVQYRPKITRLRERVVIAAISSRGINPAGLGRDVEGRAKKQ